MIFQAIILLTDSANPSLLTQEINGKPFLHYQLNFLVENLFRKIVFVVDEKTAFVQETLGRRFEQMELEYIKADPNSTQAEQVYSAFYYISDPYALVLNGSHFFRLNISKADDFRRMRESRMLAIGKIATKADLTKEIIQLDLRGQIMEMNGKTVDSESIFYTDTWLISKAFYHKNFAPITGSLFQYLVDFYKETPLFAMICRQYFIKISNTDDIDLARNEFDENNFQ